MPWKTCALLFVLFLFIVVRVLVTLDNLGTSGPLLLLELGGLRITQSSDTVRWSWQLADTVCDVTTSNQGSDNAASDDESENETVDRVPRWSPATPGGSTIGVVKEVESQKLSDQCIFDRQEKSRPSDSRSDDTNGVALVTLCASVSGPFKTPVNSPEERDNLGYIST